MAEPNQRVAFTRSAAERIANVVRTVEGGERDGAALTFGSRLPAANVRGVRICTFTGTWSIGSTNTVTVGTAPNTSTVSAVNLFFPLTSGGSRTGAVAKDGTAWYLIDVPFTTAVMTQVTTATAITVQSTSPQNVLTDVGISAVLNTSNCVISVSTSKQFATIAAVTGTATATVIASTSTTAVVRL